MTTNKTNVLEIIKWADKRAGRRVLISIKSNIMDKINSNFTITAIVGLENHRTQIAAMNYSRSTHDSLTKPPMGFNTQRSIRGFYTCLLS